MTMVEPAAMAVASFEVMKPILLFQGVMAAATPDGCRPASTVFLDGRDDRREALEVERVHDAGTTRMHTKRGEGIGRPFHEAIAFGIALEFAFDVEL